MKRYKVGVVLSGGAARGLAHAGVLQALEEEDLRPEIISGVSAGAIVGAFYADGFSPAQMLDIFIEKSMLSFVKPALPRQGLLRLTGLEEILAENLRSKKIEDLGIPLYITTTDFHSGKARVFNSGDLIPVIIASSSIPVMFVPSIIDGVMLVDGGVVDNLPLDPIRNLCDFIIGVHVNPIGYVEEVDGILHIAERSFHLAIAAQLEKKIPEFNLYIEPPELKKYGLMDVKKAGELFDIGYKEAKRVIGLMNLPAKTAS